MKKNIDYKLSDFNEKEYELKIWQNRGVVTHLFFI